MKTTVKNSLLLLLAACIWGVAFVAQSEGMTYMGPFTFNAARFLLGGTVLVPLIVWNARKAGGGHQNTEALGQNGKAQWKVTLAGGICCGLAIFSASTFQQIGIQYTTVGKAGFITTLYIIMVPLAGLLFGKKVRPVVWPGALMAAAGLYLLCVNETVSLNRGDLYVFFCAVLFTVHILVIDYFSPKADGVKLSCIQFYFSGVLSLLLALLFEEPTLSALAAGILPVLYAGVMSCGVAYTLQIVGQRGMDASVASLILSLESVVSVLAGWLILGQLLSLRERIGCVIVFAAVILVQLPERQRKTDALHNRMADAE